MNELMVSKNSRPGEKSGDVPQHSHHWKVKGLDCPNCARELESAIQRMEGIANAEIDFLGEKAKVLCYLPGGCRERVAGLGKDHGVEFFEIGENPAIRSSGRLPFEALIMVSSGLFMLLAWILRIPYFYFPAMFIAGFPVAKRAWGDLLNREISMNLLMSSAAIGAVLIKEWQEGAMVLFLFSIAKWLERMSSERARSSIEALKLQLPAIAHVVTDSGEEDSPVEKLTVGLRIRIKPGEKIPADGEVVQGSSNVDESTFSGESEAVAKSIGEKVFAGTWNQNGTLIVLVGAKSTESRFSRIMLSVERAQSRKTRFQGSVERFAAVYTPIVVLISLAVAVAPPLLGYGGFREWLYSALVLLVIACPCALVISAPVTLVSAMTAAARAGVLVRGGDIFEVAAGVKVVAFDKTGTITHGEPRILEIVPFDRSDRDSLLSIAGALEACSEHPLAVAFQSLTNLPEVSNFSMERGLGIEGVVEGKRYRFGRPDWAVRLSSWSGALPLVEASCVSLALLADEDGPLGQILLGDEIRGEAKPVSTELSKLGVKKKILLSGDRQVVAEEFGKAVGFDEAYGGLLPEEKGRKLEEFSQKIGPTLMLGDGINDTPALAAAQIGVAMGDRGSDAVLETAGAVLIHDNLNALGTFLRISKKAHRLIRQNIFLAVGLKTLVFALSLAGMATLWMAVLADTGAALLVVLNGLRALKIPEKE